MIQSSHRFEFVLRRQLSESRLAGWNCDNSPETKADGLVMQHLVGDLGDSYIIKMFCYDVI